MKEGVTAWIETHLIDRNGQPLVLTAYQRVILRRIGLLPPPPRSHDRDKTDIRAGLALHSMVVDEARRDE